jgi:DNA-binding transcriptional ArsR family regulator
MRERADVVPEPKPALDALPSSAQVDAAVGAFALLADPTRLRLLWLLDGGEHDVGTLAELTETTPAATSQQLAKLRLAGLVAVRRDGRRRLYMARTTHVRQLIREALHHADHLVSGHPDHP